MSRAVIYSPDALKYLRRMPANYSRTVRAKIDAVAGGKNTNNIVEMVNAETSRLRVGDYRVIYYMTETTMEVVKIGPRGSVYE